MILFLVGGVCSTGCYYGHLAVGQAKVLWARQPVDRLLKDPNTDPSLRAKLERVLEARDFARELGLEVEGQYTSYVPWPHDRIVTSVIATKAGEISPTHFRFPIVGEVPYKGFFDLERAEREAARLRARDMDVCVSGIRAYSTLGWFDDPLTEPMLAVPEARLVETVIHELVHATVFVNSQPDFNEGVANFIGEEASVRFFAARASRVVASSPTAAEVRLHVEDDRRIAEALMGLRAEVEALYARDLPREERERERAALERTGRSRLAALALHATNAARVAKSARLNDACLAILGTYVSDTPQHLAILERLDDDLTRFISRLRDAAASDDPRAAFFAP